MAAHPPIWLETLVEIVSNCLEAHSAMGCLAYEYRTDEDMIELIVYPTPVELVEALEEIQQTLYKLTDLFPESLVYDDDEEGIA